MDPATVLDNKIKACNELIIQNIEKSIKKEMIYKYLKDNKIVDTVKTFHLNSKDNFITLIFPDHQKAREFYERANFKEQILLRPLNIYFNLQLTEAEMKKYEFEGATDKNIRRFFEIIRTIGICKIYANYTGNSNKLKPKGMVSFIRTTDIPQEAFNKVKQQLKEIGITFNIHVPDKGIKCSVMLKNFYEGDLTLKEDEIEKKVEEQLHEKFTKILGSDDGLIIRPYIRSREVPDPDSQGGSKIETKVTATVELGDFDKTVERFQKIRQAYISEPKARAFLYFHNSENNSYISLFTMGIYKSEKYENLSDREFEDVLVKNFRNISPNVLQITIFPLNFNNTYVGRIYLKDELSGKMFIASYSEKRKFLVDFFKSTNIVFDINVDDKTQRKIKNIQRRVQQISKEIKISNDMNRRDKRPNNLQPLSSFAGMPPIGMQPMGNHQMRMVPPHSLQQGQGQGVPPMGMHNMQGMQGMPGMPGMQMTPPPSNPAQMKSRINKFLQDRTKLIQDSKVNERIIKTILTDPLKFILETQLNISKADINPIINKLMTKNDVATILDIIESPTVHYNVAINK